METTFEEFMTRRYAEAEEYACGVTDTEEGIARDAWECATEAERARWKKTEGYVCVMHPDDPMLKKLDGQLVFIQRTVTTSNATVQAAGGALSARSPGTTG